MSRWFLGLLALAAIVLAPVANAQQSQGQIYGAVEDETGGVLPGVTVTLMGAQIGTLTQTTGINGDFHFIRLDPGEYDLNCELDQFTRYEQKGIAVQVGGAVNLKIVMKPGPVTEIVIVTEQQPILDTRKTGVGQNVTQEILANVPTSRDPWVVLSMVSGIIVDRVNIAGAEGGQQSEFNSRGDVGGDNSMWNMDGVTITDMAAVGSSPTYYDFDAFEEIQVTTGGNDPSQATGGMGVNFVTKRGGDTPKGSARIYITSEGLQSNNVKDQNTAIPPAPPNGETTLDGHKWNPRFTRPILFKSRDYGIEIGGPIIKEKAWYWGAVGVQDIQTIAVGGAPDNTQLENVSFKLNTQMTENDTFTFFYYRGDKIKRGRNAGATRPIETTWNQKGPTDILKVEASHIVNPNFYINGKFGYIKGGFSLTPQGGIGAQMWRDSALVWHGSYLDYATDRPQLQLTLDTNYFMTAGGNHEFKAGFQYRRTTTESTTAYSGDRIVADEYTGTAWISRDRHAYNQLNFISFYAGDTWTAGRLTANLGVRFDQQKGKRLATSVTNTADPALLPLLSVTDADTPFTWNDISPRLGVTYDLMGDGKTIFRGSFARYADQLNSGTVDNLSPIGLGLSEIDYYWTDLNGDHRAQYNEIDFAYGPVGSYYIDPLDPTRSYNAVDGDLTAPKRLELIVGGEREIMLNFSAGANYVYRKADNLTWNPITGYKKPNDILKASEYVVAGTISGTLPDGTVYSMPYYRMNDARRSEHGAGIDHIFTNQDGYSQKYQGVELFATKRLSNKWMVNASFNYQTDREYFDGTAGIQDPTNIHDGDDLAFQSGASGKTNYWIGTPKWQFNANGMYQFVYGISASANLISREGFPVVYYRSRFYVDPGVITKNVRAKKMSDALKLPNMMELDVRVSKAVSLGDKGNINLDLDIFNILNKSSVLHVQESLSSSSLDQVQDLMYPRTVRLGLRYSF
ncbi:MAG: carboxypeptidase regulatory-like domain-containing protein [Acidobacteriota bacterium]